MRDLSNLSFVWSTFFNDRTERIQYRYPGFYRAVVVETNDPLQIYRVRFKCPELHDFSLKPEECPWAVPDPKLGSKICGSWEHPEIGDIIFITFEKSHTYGPIWTGFAMGTRRKRYPLESIYCQSPKSVDDKGKPADKPDDFIKEYLPKDFRPQATGWRDRYGSSEINSAIGFFPKEHEEKPATPGMDAISKSEFEKGEKPEVNKPDRKYYAKLTKYGTFTIQSDVGYFWKKEDDGDVGEFKGVGDDMEPDGKEEREFEVDRYKFFTKLFNEDEPESEKRDQRRYEVRTRAGHKFEMRDVGYAQKDGGLCGCEPKKDMKCREEEGKYTSPPRILSKWEKSDERWVKWRTKGGHLIQMMDAGFHPEEDEFYKRKLIEECGPDVDEEDKSNWTKRDSRQIRFVTRWGIKLVLDDRGTDPRKAHEEENPRGVGFLLKTRRSWEPDGGSPRGFGIEAVDKDDLNTTRWYTPKSKCVEMNDRKDYVMMCTDMSGEISRPWKGLEENEFALDITMGFNPEEDTYHLKLDKRNGYIRLKTSGGKDNKRRPKPEPEQHKAECKLKDQSAPGEELKEIKPPHFNQGVEMRDGDDEENRCAPDGPWTEVVDSMHRGMWFTRKYNMGIWRPKASSDQFIVMNDGESPEDEEKGFIIIRNNRDGPVQIYCQKDVEIISDQDINLMAKRDISIKAGRNMMLQSAKLMTQKAGEEWVLNAGSGKAHLNSTEWKMNKPDRAPSHEGFLPGAADGDGAQSSQSGGNSALPTNIPEQKNQNPQEPTDRAKTCNDPFTAVDEAVIKQC
jgi:hypothetical protein